MEIFNGLIIFFFFALLHENKNKHFHCRPDVNAQIYDDLDTLTQFGRLTRIYKSLSPYIKEAVAQNTNEHIPVMRPLFLQYPDDPIGNFTKFFKFNE